MIPATISDGFLLALESHMRRHGQGPHLSATVVELEGSPDEARISNSATKLAQRHPLLNARIKRGGDFIPYWHASEASPLPYTVHQADEIDAKVSELIGKSRIDILSDGPNLEIHAVPLKNRSAWALILIWPHALFDAVGLEKLLHEFDSDDNVPCEAWGETAKTPARINEQWKAAKPMVEEFRKLPAWRIRSLHKKQACGGPCLETIRWNKEETQTIYEKMTGTAGNLLMLPYFACCAARAVRTVLMNRYKDEDIPMLLSLPVQRATSPGKRPLFQNHMVPYSLLMEPAELEDLKKATRALFQKYGQFIRRKLPDAMDALMKLMERCPSRFYLKPASFYLKGEICSLFHSHTGEFAKGQTSMWESMIINGYHIPTVSSPPAIGIFCSEKNEQLTCTISWREGMLSSEELQMLRKSLIHDLTKLSQPSVMA